LSDFAQLDNNIQYNITMMLQASRDRKSVDWKRLWW